MISGPYVINLEHRTDRWSSIVKGFSAKNITPLRIDAIYRKGDGATGCLESHIKALKASANTKGKAEAVATWVCEDDCIFLVDKAALDTVISSFMASDAKVLCLGYNSRKDVPYNTVFRRTLDNQTCTSYIVKESFRNHLIKFWESVLVCRKAKTKHIYKDIYTNLKVHQAEYECTDQCWKVLQQDHIFVIPHIRCAIQKASYSDIEEEHVDYGL